MTGAFPQVEDEDLLIEVRSPDKPPLVRLFRWEGSAFGVPAPEHRIGRFDPPPGHRDVFAVLYTAEHVETAAIECRVLASDANDQYTYSYKTPQHRVVRLKYTKPALFIRVDSPSAKKWGIGRFKPTYEQYQGLALTLYERYGTVIHGLSWQSYHRGGPGRNYGFWHSQKSDAGLEILQPEEQCPFLHEDPEWLAFLNEHKEAVHPAAPSEPV